MSEAAVNNIWTQLSKALDRVQELSDAHQALAKRVAVLEGRVVYEKLPDKPMPDVVKTGRSHG